MIGNIRKKLSRKGVFKIKGKIYIGFLTGILMLLLLLSLRENAAGNMNGEKQENAANRFFKSGSGTIDAEDNKKVVQGPEIRILAESGFYEEDIWIEVELEKEGSIFYTFDGSMPDRVEGGGTHLYKGPILLTAGEEESAEVYRFLAVYDDGTESEAVTNTYFMGRDIKNRYDTLVISLAAEDDDLYGFENGIFVEGKLRADWEAEHPKEEAAFDTPANYNVRGRESERNVHVEIFDEDGRRVVAQNGGIRISGNFTRQSEQKSFKLYARKGYDEADNRFRYPLFEDMRSAQEGNVFGKYKSLKIRNTGNDRSEGFIRDELGMTLAAQAGFPDTQSVRPVSVYINGIYKGLYWMHSAYDEEYFEEKYGEFDGEMVVIGSGEMNMAGDPDDETENHYALEYNEVYAKYSSLDLTEDEICKELNGYIDIENYLQYFALEVYMANRDWPYNNLQAYRYVAPDGGGYAEDSVFDGRYRYLLYDVDTTMGLGTIKETLDPDQSFETLALLEERGYAPLFTALMGREDCRNYFVSYVCDLLNGAYSAENVADVLEGMHQLRENEMLKYIEESIKNPELLEIGDVYLEMQMECIRAWAQTASDSMLEGMRRKWQLGEVYTIYVQLPDKEGARINGLTVTDAEFTGRYLTGCSTYLAPVLPIGRKFSYWEINGKRYEEEEILVEEDMLMNGALYAVLYSEESGAGLELSEMKAKGKGDYIILTNTSDEDVNTWGYYLMDKEKASHMNYLEAVMLAPGESILIGCKNYDGSDAFMRVNFNLKRGREVMLAYAGTGVKERVTLPNLGMDQGVYRKNAITGIWQEERGTSDGA